MRRGVLRGSVAASLGLALLVSGARAEQASPARAPLDAPADEWNADEDWLFDGGPDPAERDDIETSNRLTFGFNEGFYRYIADPVAKGFAWAVPAPGRRAVYRFFENLESPALLLNDVLQLAPLDATKTASRFVINSTVGIAGLFDPAAALGIEIHHTDFGETLGVWGVPSGSYVLIPVLGPSTARDTFGEVVDALLHPTMWFVSPVQQVLIRTSDGLSAYDVERERLDARRATAVDFYAAIRGAYLLDRDAHVAKRVEGRWWRSSDELPASAAAAE
jgi:phospholipid-binding lipoprotein MlaA